MTTIVRRLCTAALAGSAVLLSTPWAAAQTPPAPAASSAAGERDSAISDRVKKDAASPLYWIRLNAQKPETGGVKAGPKITEVRPVAPAAANPARAVAASPAPAPGGTPAGAAPAANAAAARPAVSGGANLPAVATGDLPPPVAASNTTAAAAPSTAQAANPAATAPAGPGLPSAGAGISAAGLAGGSAPSAADAARAATAASTAAAADDDEDDQPLALLKASEPEFSAVAMRRLRKGSVQVKFDVQPDGHVTNATVVQTTNRTLNEAALEAVNAWVFKPVRSARSAVVDLGFDLDS